MRQRRKARPSPIALLPSLFNKGETMLINHLKIALRHLLKHKGYSFINIAGLATGMACCLLMALLVKHEFSFDRFHRNAARIYRVVTQRQSANVATTTVASPLQLAEALKNEFPEVVQAVRLGRGWPGVMRYEDRKHQEADLFFADATIFKVFDLEMVLGNPETALQNLTGIVITEAMAQKYFGAANPLGRALTYTFEGAQQFEVTGVVKALPSYSHFHFDFLAALASQQAFVESMGADWQFNFIPTYLLLSEEAAAAAVENRLKQFVARVYPAPLKNEISLSLQALTDIHLHSQYDGEIGANGSTTEVGFYAGIALLLLLIACVNFMNLSTARSADRSREVGVRKVMGAQRGQLVQQFLGETLVLCFFAVTLAIALVEFALPLFNDLTGKSLRFFGSDFGATAAMLAALALMVGLAAGSYPAFYLSAFQPVKALKGVFGNARAGAPRLRQLLVVGQFAVSVIFLIGIAVMHRQLDYIETRPLGYKKEEVVFIRSPQREERMNFELFRQELKAVTGVREATGASAIPGSGQSFSIVPVHGEGMATEARVEMAVNWIEHDFAEAFGLEVIAGRNFSPEFSTDPSEGLLINETAAAALGWRDNAVGKRLAMYRPERPDPIFSGRVVGVIKDFHFQSLHLPIKPMVMTCRPVFNRTYIALRLQSGNLSATLAGIEAAWKKLAPEWPLELSFLNATTAAQYLREQRVRRVIGYAAFLAVFIACLGLFALAAFAAEQRTKEIGVRKVLGASVAGIVGLLSKDFVKLVLAANVIAWPVAYFAMNKWLQNFAYRIDISWWIFALASGLALLIALLTVSAQAIKAALANPVEALRYE
jgi:putative ABC transport system permease protein